MAIRGAGMLRERLHFQKRSPGDDGWGNAISAGGFVTQFTAAANLRPLVGSEAVQASRLAGRQPYLVTVRQSSKTRLVTSDWQIVDARDEARVFAVSAPPSDPDGKRAWLEILATEGVVS